MNDKLFDSLIASAIIIIFCSIIGAVIYGTYRIFGLFGCIVYIALVAGVFFWVAADIMNLSRDDDSEPM